MAKGAKLSNRLMRAALTHGLAQTHRAIRLKTRTSAYVARIGGKDGQGNNCMICFKTTAILMEAWAG
ncbi:hypothetical protein XH93_09390 [Bradyrhizobium sp. CCBAU 51753]|nr:hypothetical protein XH93_09390 [Bradyrhizobium sp. CCBAU 51753]